MMSAPVRILLAEDHAIVREGLRAILESREGLLIVGEAKDGRETLTLAEKTSPDVIIMDINMEGLNGIEATRQILAQFPRMKVVGLSVHMQSPFITEMLVAGAVGYVPKKSAAQELLTAIETVMEGKMYISPEVTEQLVKKHGGSLPRLGESDFSRLSGREREVLQLLAEGNSVKEIADLLSLSVPTIHTHRQHIMQKLSINSVAELTKYAIRMGLTSLED